MVGLYTRLAAREVTHAKAHYHLERNPSCVSISQSRNQNISMTVATIKCRPRFPGSNCQIDPNLRTTPNGEQIMLLDTTETDLPGIIEAYAKDIAPTFHHQEQSEALKTTLTLASQLSVETQVRNQDSLYGKIPIHLIPN